MADYWVSQGRKYCDFCKCWITDNRPSIDFHEKGRRHQENLKRRLQHITKQSTKQQQELEKFDSTLRQIEAAALNAYKKDVKNNNSDLTSLSINQNQQQSTSGTIDCAKKLWHEAKHRDGTTYYYNVITNEKVNTPPKDGFMNIKEQKDAADLQTKKQLHEADKYSRQQALLQLQTTKKEEAEERSRLAREKMKERKVNDDILLSETTGPLLEPGKNDPYGKWQTVKELEVPDLQLPQQEFYYEPVVVEFEPEPKLKEFKEKTIEKIDDNGSNNETASFKKRKIGAGTKRNVRQRLNDD